MNSANSTTIERLQCRYLVPVEYPAPDDLRSRLDVVARDRLPEACSRWLTRFLDENDSSVWLIRQLNLDLALDVGSLDNDSLADVWGCQVALCIAHTLANGADDDTVRYFIDQAAYTAQFIADLASGRAWGKWYYRPFDAVSSLSTSTAIRTVLTREPKQIGEILVRLSTQKRLEPVLSSLNEVDARILYEHLFISNGAVEQVTNVFISGGASAQTVQKHIGAAGTGERQLVDLLLSLWPTASLQLSGSHLATAHNALRLYAALCEHKPGLISGDAQVVIDNLLVFTEVLRQVSQPAKLVNYLVANNLTGALQLLSSSKMTSYLESLSFLQQVALGDCTLIRRIAHTVAISTDLVPDQEGTGRHQGEARKNLERVNTLLGGLFLLLPTLLDLRLHQFIESIPYPDPQGMDKAQVLRYLLSLKCFAQLYAQWKEIVNDPILLFIAGLGETPSLESLQHFSQSITQEMNQACTQLLIKLLTRLKYVEGRCLYAELVDTSSPGDKILLLRDMKSDTWVYATYVPTDIREIQHMLIHGLAQVQKSVDIPTEYLVIGPDLGQLLELDVLHERHIRVVWTEPDQVPGALPHRLDTPGGGDSITVWMLEQESLPPEVGSLLERYLRRVRPAAKDMAYLTLVDHKQPIIHNRDVDLTWSLVARALLKTFARRLMGFDWNSLEYLYANFLAGTSTIQFQRDLVEVRLPCSPLHILLRMAGVNGQAYMLPWQNDTQVTLVLAC